MIPRVWSPPHCKPAKPQDASGLHIRIDDPIAKELDVMGNNEYIGWYAHTIADLDKTDWSSDYNKPLIMSEWGGDALFGYHGDAETRFTEEFKKSSTSIRWPC